MSIAIVNLAHEYLPGTPFAQMALADVNLHIAPGELIGLIGHTGSGKSTLIQHINGLLLPTAGRVEVEGKRTDDKKAVLDIRKNVGLVFQYPEYQLFEETVFQDVAYGPKNLGQSPEQVEQAVRYGLELVELEYQAVWDKSPFELSGGQRRRVAIAGVLAMRPRTIVLDEPTSGLDPLASKNILNMIAKMRDDAHTVIMVSHNMDEVAPLASRIVVISQGRIVLDDTPGKVFCHTQQLLSLGLDVPTGCRIAFELRERGVKVPEDIVQMEELAAWIKQEVGG